MNVELHDFVGPHSKHSDFSAVENLSDHDRDRELLARLGKKQVLKVCPLQIFREMSDAMTLSSVISASCPCSALAVRFWSPGKAY